MSCAVDDNPSDDGLRTELQGFQTSTQHSRVILRESRVLIFLLKGWEAKCTANLAGYVPSGFSWTGDDTTTTTDAPAATTEAPTTTEEVATTEAPVTTEETTTSSALPLRRIQFCWCGAPKSTLTRRSAQLLLLRPPQLHPPPQSPSRTTLATWALLLRPHPRALPPSRRRVHPLPPAHLPRHLQLVEQILFKLPSLSLRHQQLPLRRYQLAGPRRSSQALEERFGAVWQRPVCLHGS